MELIQFFIDLILNLDQHLVNLMSNFGVWIYAILFLIIFVETGLVVMPFLPGDSLLFAVGALAAVDTSGTLEPWPAFLLLSLAAILGNTLNYSIGAAIGPRAFTGKIRLLKPAYLRSTEEFFERHGGKTIILSRYVPIIRTCAPFVAGVGRMQYGRFQLHNCVGGITWVGVFIAGGYLFGNIPLVKNNFGVVTLLIIAASLVPVVLGVMRSRAATSR